VPGTGRCTTIEAGAAAAVRLVGELLERGRQVFDEYDWKRRMWEAGLKA
jgi:hypothetical protein